jgi:hypothetical protein
MSQNPTRNDKNKGDVNATGEATFGPGYVSRAVSINCIALNTQGDSRPARHRPRGLLMCPDNIININTKTSNNTNTDISTSKNDSNSSTNTVQSGNIDTLPPALAPLVTNAQAPTTVPINASKEASIPPLVSVYLSADGVTTIDDHSQVERDSDLFELQVQSQEQEKEQRCKQNPNQSLGLSHDQQIKDDTIDDGYPSNSGNTTALSLIRMKYRLSYPLFHRWSKHMFLNDTVPTSTNTPSPTSFLSCNRYALGCCRYGGVCPYCTLHASGSI